jgi:NTP pyrophosphatase (non-canonical NTP hydrolase)
MSRHTMKALVVEHFNKLTPAEAERLALLAEECGEVLHAIGKVLRHGYESRHPLDGADGETNRHALQRELGDLHFAMDLLVHHDLNAGAVLRAEQSKRERVGVYLHHTKIERAGE